MSSRRRGDLSFPLLTVAVDAMAIEGAFLLSYWLRFNSTLFDSLGFIQSEAPPFRGYLLGSFFVTAVWLLLFDARHMFGMRRSVTLTDELFNVVKVVTQGMLIVMSAAFFYREFSYSRVVFGLLWGLSITLVYFGRATLQALERRLYRKGRHLQRVILVGNDDLADQVYGRLHRHPSFGYFIDGYFADKPAAPPLRISGSPYLGPVPHVREYVLAHRIELAFIALRAEDHPRLIELVNGCEGINIEFMMVPDLLEILTSQVKARELDGIPFLKIKSVPLSGWGRIVKRFFDIVVSLLLLLALSPLILLVSLAIVLDSRGPVFFRQRRIGLDGTEFLMVKFRSMRAGAEEQDDQAGLGVRNDPRRTRIGSILRSTSIDELPQLFNVLKGEMSIVGPRPERTRYVQEFQANVPKYLDRHRVKTGMTGWAQVNGLRGDTSIEERIKYDLYYIENWSLVFDLKILLRTLRAALSTREGSSS